MTQAYSDALALSWSEENGAAQDTQMPAARPWPADHAMMARKGLDMSNPVSVEATINPMTNAEAYNSSLKSLLARNTGYFIVATFQTGGEGSVVWQGILHTVGSDYIVIYQPEHDRYISGDLYALKFVEFHNSRTVPYHASANQWRGHHI